VREEHVEALLAGKNAITDRAGGITGTIVNVTCGLVPG
jgi:hypothetical protein